MLKRSWFYQNGFYYTLLAFILLLHFIALVVRFNLSLEVSDAGKKVTPPIKISLMEPKDFTRKKLQIVESENKSTDIKPNSDAFLSDKDRSFDRQTRAMKVAPFNQGGRGQSLPQEGTQAGKAQTRKEDLSLADLGAFRPDHDPIKVAAENYAKKPQDGGNNGQGRGVSSSSDHVEGIPLGDLTYLNTVEYKYYGFFHRIKQKLEQFWGRSIYETAESLLKSGRQIATEENLTTALKVTMNQQGEIISITVEGSSGVKELDDAAIESFNQAGPFPNPPKGLIVNGKVQIEWGFVVNT